MPFRAKIWMVTSIVLFIAAAWFWHLGEQRRELRRQSREAQPANSAVNPAAAPQPGQPAVPPPAAATTNASVLVDPEFPNRLRNTTKSIEELIHSDRAILLENALIETGDAAPLRVPASLRALPGHGNYVVQAHGPIDPTFRDWLQRLGAEVIAYIPNNAYLVRLDDGAVRRVAALPIVQAVLPFEPYYKIEMPLLNDVIAKRLDGKPTLFKVLAFPSERRPAITALEVLGGQIVGETRHPFGPMFFISMPADRVTAMAQVSSVQRVERLRDRQLANDLTRVRVRVSLDTTTPAPAGNHLGLTGTGIIVNVNDSGIDYDHPDLAGRVLGAPLPDDTDGHGTHVAGIIASSGASSPTVLGGTNVANIPGSIPGADFRGMAPAAELFWQPVDLLAGPVFSSDELLQQGAAQTNALISNNSWGYIAAFGYDSAAASWDEAVRDSLPEVTGDQPVLYVFSAGNSGGGQINGQGGLFGTITSPGTAKNVITVGAIEQNRRISSNYTVCVNGVLTTNSFFAENDSSSEVAFYSSRGNVNPGFEGAFGRFKPDLVAPGSFVLSLNSQERVINTNLSSSQAINAPGQLVQPGGTNLYQFDLTTIPGTVTGTAYVILTPNNQSPVPFPALDLLFDVIDPPTFINPPEVPVSPNFFVLPFSAPSPLILNFAVVNNNSQPVAFDATLIVVIDNCGDRPAILEALNLLADPGQLYRYESGTSMSAPVVSGMAALIKEYLNTQGLTNASPALIKAMLINGARSASPAYNFSANTFLNLQGWGVPNLTNSLPFDAGGIAGSTRMQIVDQSAVDSLATGDTVTYPVTLVGDAIGSPLRVTLVWTDPPGNPAASAKLVNDLDLVVTNLDTGDVYLGNIFGAGIFSTAFSATNFATNTAVPFDRVNNVENVYVENPAGMNFTVTVRAKRVNVNSRDDYYDTTVNVNDVRQDFALVIATDLISTNLATNTPPVGSMTVSAPTTTANPNPEVITFTNSIAASNSTPVFGQRIGANPALLFVANTNGLPAQWAFYVITNDMPNGSNVVFATFFPPNLSRARIREADIDLFVSQDPDLTNLTPAVVDGALRSVRRGGTELITLSNSSQGEVFYVGVKSEDAQGADFGFFAAASDQPFSFRDTNGNLIVNFINVPQLIPDGDPAAPQGAIVFGVAIDDGLPGQIQRMILTNTITHEDVGDLQTVLIAPPNDLGDQTQVILTANNIFQDESTNTRTYVFDDSLQNEPPPPPPLLQSQSVGPGTLNNLIGQSAFGLWQFNAIDNAPVFSGSVDFVSFRVEPTRDTNGAFFDQTIAPGGCFLDAVSIPPSATNFSVDVTILTAGGVAELYIRRGQPPTPGIYNQDKFILIGPAPNAGTLSVTPSDSPPLNAGLYYVMICNPDTVNPLSVRIRYRIDLAPTPGTPVVFTNSAGPITILDDAVTNSVINVPNNQTISDIAVGVRIDHDRVADLVLHLRSPQGTRVLLAENRGGLLGQDYGADVAGLTNVVGIETNNFDTAVPGLYTVGNVVDSWTVQTNPVTVVDNVAIADTPTRFLALSTGAVTRTLPTVAGQQYMVTFRYRQNLPLSINGSFENPPGFVGATYNAGTTIGGWTVASGDVNHALDFPAGWEPADGTSSYDLNGNAGPGSIYRDVVTTPGQRYQLEFALSGNGFGGPVIKTFNVAWAGAALSSLSYDTTGNAYSNMLWVYTNYVVTGSGSDRLQFSSTTPTVFGPALDDISLTPLAEALVDIPGVVTTNIVGTQTWQTFTATFTAAGPTPMTIAGIDGGMLIDSFVLSEVQLVTTTLFTFFNEDTNFTSRPMKYGLAPFIDNGLPVSTTNYFLPEEPMTPFRGQNASGDWRLEIWDNRLGAPLGTLLDWQLSITFNSSGPVVTPIFNGQCVTNTLAGSGRQYYAVIVPASAAIGTNSLTSFGGAVDLEFNQNFLPSGGGPGDVSLLTGVTATQDAILDTTTPTVPPLMPGTVYYLAVENANPTDTNTYEICVRFDVTSITSGSFVSAAVAPGKTAYYTFNVPIDSASAVFDLTSLSAPADLVVSQGPEVPTDDTYHYKSAKPGTSDEQIVVTPASWPAGLAPGEWNIGVVNKSETTVSHQVRATAFDSGGNAAGSAWKPVAFAPATTPGTGAQVTWNTLIGAAYEAQYTSNMVNWVTFTNFTADKVITTIVDPTPQSTLDKRFYRLLKLP